MDNPKSSWSCGRTTSYLELSESSDLNAWEGVLARMCRRQSPRGRACVPAPHPSGVATWASTNCIQEVNLFCLALVAFL